MPAIHDLQGFMDAVRASFDAERARGRSATLQYLFSGATPCACYLVVADGALSIGEGRHPAPAITVRADFDLWQRIVTYQLDPLLAYQDGLYAVEGDVEALMETDTWFVRTVR